ncbi:DNA translocase FtsK [Sporosarcina sp. ITBMC105]
MIWIKKLMNRVFETENEQEYRMEDHENQNERELETTEQTSNERPAFRFPIITDAEIYGWGPDDQNEEREKKSKEQLVTQLDDDDFEPVPLYKNERWPGERKQGVIHRANAPAKYKTEKKQPQTVEHPKPKPSSGEEAVRTSIIQKRSNRPFTPTEVPSPVYGYMKPSDRVAKTDTSYQGDLPKNDSNAHNSPVTWESEKDVRYDAIRHDELNQERIDEVPANMDVENELQPAYDDSIVDGHEEQISETASSVEHEQTALVHESTIPEEELVEPEPFDALSETNYEDGQTSYEVEREDLESTSSVVGKEFIATDEEAPTIESSIEIRTSNDSSHMHTSTERKKEKTVPFNVLMLKNDKMKYESQQQMKQTVSKNLNGWQVSSEQDEGLEVESLNGIDEQPSSMHAEEEQPFYAFPPKDFLVHPEAHIEDTEWLQTQSVKLEEALSYFAIQATVIEAVQGPTVTRFELTVGHGTKVSKVRNLTDDLKLALAAEDIRIQAPIPGTSSIGIEIPNRKPRAVRISEVIETKRFQESDSPLEAVLGLSLTGEPVTLDLRKMPHGMIAGATGSGKSVCINSILISLLYKSSPTDLKMLLIDPKMVELAPYNGIPHLLSPVITDVKAATAALKWAVGEMERRYELFAHAGARNIERYNEMAEKDRKFSLKLPYLLIVIDELADLMMMAPADVEVSISRITQKARACGIHLIIATQRPSVDVITGTIKANVPTRIAFSVSSQIDSRTIIDTPGAERLLGKGDMLYLGNGQSSAVRLQGTFVTDGEIERIIEHVQNEAEPDYLFGQEDLLANAVEEEESDPLFADACLFIIEQQSASTSLLQRNFSIGYNRAAKLMDRMEKLGFISEQRGSKAREVFVTESSFDNYLNGTERT